MYVTLKLNGSEWGRFTTPGPQGPCRIHSMSDGNKEIVTNQRYMVMSWKMVTRCSANITLKEAVEEIKKCEDDRRLVSELRLNIEMKYLRYLG